MIFLPEVFQTQIQNDRWLRFLNSSNIVSTESLCEIVRFQIGLGNSVAGMSFSISASYNANDCSCELPCAEIDFTTEVSYSQFPNDGIAKVLEHLHHYNKTSRYQR